jgi:hypothetical protein
MIGQNLGVVIGVVVTPAIGDNSKTAAETPDLEAPFSIVASRD